MDSEVKKQIKSLVLNLRNLFEDDLAVVLKRYGIFTDRAWLPVDKIPKADDEILHTRQRLEAAMQPNLERGVKRPEAARLYVREAGFTYLNRLVGLKVLEVRDLFPETIQTRPEYGGRSLYQRDFRAAHPELAKAADDALPAALEAACRDVSQQIRFVFEVESESSILWPRYAALKEAIQRINALPVEVWQEDEIIGWIYQFYNAEEKKAIRKRGKPKLPIEVAVINQFFTPRWIVKYLVDNTLGRLWLEMHPDSQGVRAKCDYLVPEPLGVPEDGGEEGKIQLDPDSPVNNPAAAPRREPKRPQDIRLIDPACGTMHFGHYAFEVFQEIYRDAREQGWVEAEDALEDKDIPLSILKHNLYGVDIDLRAVQLAALSLYIKARTSQRAAGMEDGEAVRLPWSVNLVCADARLTDGGMRERFLSSYADDPVLVRAWKELFREMEDIGQVGSLLRVEERFRQILRDYKPPTVSGLAHTHQESLPGIPAAPRQMNFGETEGGGSWSLSRTLTKMLLELQTFARQAFEEYDVNVKVFSAEAQKTLGLLDILMHNYDIVLMNPPYGKSTDKAKEYIDKTFPITKYDLYISFIERSVDFTLKNKGFIGALTSRTFLQLPRFQNFRKSVLAQTKPILIADLGFAVLDDAMVETAASVFVTNPKTNNPITCFNLTRTDVDVRHAKLNQSIDLLWKAELSSIVYVRKQNIIKRLPRNVIAYWAPESIISLFEKSPHMSKMLAEAKTGLQTNNDSLFVRYHWEVDPKQIGKERKWVQFAKGGEYSKYYSDIYLVVDWEDDGRRIKEPIIEKWGSASKHVRSESLYFREGLTYPSTTVKGFNVRYMPSGCIFGLKGPAIFPIHTSNLWYTLGFLNSYFVYALLRILTPSRSFDVTAIGLLPTKIPSKEIMKQISNWSRHSHDIKAEWDTGNETSTHYIEPWLLMVYKSKLFNNISEELGSLKISIDNENIDSLLNILKLYEKNANSNLQKLQNNIDQSIFDIYGLPSEDRIRLRDEVGPLPKEFLWAQMEKKSAKEKRKEHVRRLISFFVLDALKSDPDGILPLVKVRGEKTVIDYVRRKLELEFGEQRAFRFEREVTEELGKSIENWLDREFIQWHNRLYSKCPIIWHLTSPNGTFACFIYYHKLSKDILLSVRTVYLWPLRDSVHSKLKAASEKKDYNEINKLEEALADIEEFDQALAKVIDSGWDPDIDAGVKANILPLQEAGLLRYKVI